VFQVIWIALSFGTA